MIEPNHVIWMDIERAKDFIRKPLSKGFNAWTTLRDRDNVTMTIHELAHLMAWYALIRVESRQASENPRRLEAGQLALPEESKND